MRSDTRVSMCRYLPQQFITAGASAELEPFCVGLKRSVRSIDPSHCGDVLSNFMAGLLPDPEYNGWFSRRRGGLSLYRHPDIPDGCRRQRLSQRSVQPSGHGGRKTPSALSDRHNVHVCTSFVFYLDSNQPRSRVGVGLFRSLFHTN